jgi:hypothetical protein
MLLKIIQKDAVKELEGLYAKEAPVAPPGVHSSR